MKRTELLGVMLKTIGVWIFVAGVARLPVAFSHWGQYEDEREFLVRVGFTFAHPVVLTTCGWFLVRATDRFARIGYPASPLTDDKPGDDESARELFGAILKAIGCWQIILGVAGLPYELALAYELSKSVLSGGIGNCAVVIIAGCFLVFGTDWFVRFAYREVVATDDDLPTDRVEPESPAD